MPKFLMNINGKISDYLGPKNEGPVVSVLDRGFLYGDSLYEVARTYQGKPFQVREHLNRLKISAKLARMTLSQSLEVYEKEMNRTIAEFRNRFRNQNGDSDEVYCRLIVTRGIGKIGFGNQAVETPTQFIIIAKPLEEPDAETWERGAKLEVVSRLRNDPRALDPAMKSGNYLNSLLAFQEATQDGFDDALLSNHEGFLTEGTTFNIFYVKRDRVFTPPLSIGILDGITRKDILRIAREAGHATHEVLLTKERLYEADEVFLTSTTKEAFPVIQVDQHKIRSGKPGPITRKLKKLIHEWALLQ